MPTAQEKRSQSPKKANSQPKGERSITQQILIRKMSVNFVNSNESERRTMLSGDDVQSIVNQTLSQVCLSCCILRRVRRGVGTRRPDRRAVAGFERERGTQTRTGAVLRVGATRHVRGAVCSVTSAKGGRLYFKFCPCSCHASACISGLRAL